MPGRRTHELTLHLMDASQETMEGELLIYLSKHLLEDFSYLIEQSIQGNHVLFEADSIRNAFGDQVPEMSEAEAYEMEHLLEKLFQKSTLQEKRDFLSELEPEAYQRVVQLYFMILGNQVFERMEVRH